MSNSDFCYSRCEERFSLDGRTDATVQIKISKMKFIKFYHLVLLLIIGVFISISSCTDEQLEISEQEISESLKVETRSNEAFSYNGNVTVNDGILNFASYDDFNDYLLKANLASHESLNTYEDQRSFKSQRRVFYDVLFAEDELDDYLYSLTDAEQSSKLQNGEYTSNLLQEAITNGLIKYYSSPDDNTSYWDYTLVEPSVAPAVNSQGLVRVEGKLIKYSNSAYIYVIHDGDINKLSTAESKTDNYEDGTITVINRGPYHPEGPNNPTDKDPGVELRSNCSADGIHTVNYSKTNSWRYPTNKKRLKAWIDGSATSNFGQPCRYGTTCTFYLRTQAQKKNFWGKWKYSSSWGPYCFVDDGDWDYDVEFIEPAGQCSSNTQSTLTNFITGGSYPKPLWDKYIPWTNNGFFGMHPHTNGWWTFSQGSQKKHICRTIDISYNIPTQYYTYGPNIWNLNN